MRARILHPSFFTSEQVCSLTFAERLLFEGLWCMADREGRLEDRPRLIKRDIFPFDPLTPNDIDSMITHLTDAIDDEGEPLVRRYTVGAKHYLELPGFTRHQRIHVREAKSKIPANPGAPQANLPLQALADKLADSNGQALAGLGQTEDSLGRAKVSGSGYGNTSEAEADTASEADTEAEAARATSRAASSGRIRSAPISEGFKTDDAEAEQTRKMADEELRAIMDRLRSERA